MFFRNSLAFSMTAAVGNLISGSPAFSKSSFNIWKFMVHILLKTGLENFEHYFASVWDECNCVVVWTSSLAFPFFGTGIKTDLLLWPLLSFPNLLAYWLQHFNSIILQDLKWISWNSIISTNFVQWCFLRPTWLCTPTYLVLGEWLHRHGYLGH